MLPAQERLEAADGVAFQVDQRFQHQRRVEQERADAGSDIEPTLEVKGVNGALTVRSGQRACVPWK